MRRKKKAEVDLSAASQQGALGSIPPPGQSGMFSAASFAGILGSEPGDGQPAPVAEELPSPPIVAFYGFRGGAGRTTALAHFAAELAARSVSTIVLDLDVEAPGIHHVLDCPPLPDDTGTVALLREAAMLGGTEDEPASGFLRLAPHILKSRLDVGTPIRVIPAGRLSRNYLERLEDLGVPLWHIGAPPSPLERLVQRVREELKPGAILLDCRTGLSALSATAVFQVADVLVLCLPVSEQSLEGLDVVLAGVHASRTNRKGFPELLIVPTMVPEGPDGRRRLTEWFIPEIEERYARVFPASPDAEIESAERTPLVREGIEYRRGIALADHLSADYFQRSAGTYSALTRELDRLLRLNGAQQQHNIDIDAPTVVRELQASELKKLAFAEEAHTDELVKKFIRPTDFKAIAHVSTWYVIGAKGAGKTWMWKYLASEVGQGAMPDVAYIPGHEPRDALLSPSALRELEKEAKLKNHERYGAFWLLYAAHRLLKAHPDALTGLKSLTREQARGAQRLARANDGATLQAALKDVLASPNAATFAEHLIRALDTALLDASIPTTILLYDGLDVGFGSDQRGIERRRAFVSGLVEAIEPLRGTSKRVAFKLFLREDMFGELGIQNQSHLDAASVELKWEPSDIWALILNAVWESKTYQTYVRAIDSSAMVGRWPVDEKGRVGLLTPLWGDEMERGNKVQTARFIQRRTADGKDRLFPRTVIQLLAAAVEHQAALAPATDRVLRSASIIQGYNEASKHRVNDLRKEYVGLETYLDALKGTNPTGTEAEIIAALKKGVKRKPAGARGGAAKGSLHAGSGGWHKVMERLLEIGVMREYKRARGADSQKKYETALLYRPGLGVKTFGV